MHDRARQLRQELALGYRKVLQRINSQKGHIEHKQQEGHEQRPYSRAIPLQKMMKIHSSYQNYELS